MEYMGHNQTATYTIGPKTKSSTHFLPQIGSLTARSKTMHDLYPTPSPVRRSLTNLAWRPATYYQTTRVQQSDIPLRRSILEPPMTDRGGTTSALTELEGIRVPPLFSAARNALYTRYTPNDWTKSALANYASSDNVRSLAEKVRYDTVRLAKETDDKTKRALDDSGKKLGERVCDINFFKNELHNETDNIINESNQLSESKRIAEKMLAETENPLHIAQECLYNREKRAGIDLVHDAPEKSLLNEVDEIKRCQDKIAHVIDKANVQLSLNRAAQHELEKDSQDKYEAQKLDETAHGLRNSSAGIAYHNGVETVNNCISTPQTWANFTNNNLQRSQAEREASRKMREEIQACINECQENMRKRWAEVNQSLTQRIQETTGNRNNISDHLSKVLQEIFDMEKNIEYLKKSILDKEAPMKVANTRLQIRLGRSNMEACQDQARSRLIQEVQEIRETVDNLRQQLRDSEASLQNLLSVKSNLEADLNVKTNSLHIDREKCIGIRKTFPMSVPMI